MAKIFKLKFTYLLLFTALLLIILSACVDTLSKYAEPLKKIKTTSNETTNDSENKSFSYTYDDLPTNYTPESDPSANVDELGLWMHVNKLEKNTVTSGSLIKDEKVNAYVKKVFCKVSPEYCNEIRIYIIHAPFFNASMYPNGMMHIWTGALLRIQNEAQLASLIGHELAHYLRRHTYTAMERAITYSGTRAWAGILLGAAGLGNINSLLQLGLQSNFFSYGRNAEREADGYGLVLMTRAGYDPESSSNLWQRLNETSNKNIINSIIFYNTHPSSKERERELRRLSRVIPTTNKKVRGKNEYIKGIESLVPLLFSDEIKYGKFESSMKLFDKLIEDEFYVPYSYFAIAEFYRTSEKERDLNKAIENYRISEQYDPHAVKDLYKSIGLTQYSINKKEKAKKSFQKYLDLNPKASDAEFIKMYMEEL